MVKANDHEKEAFDEDGKERQNASQSKLITTNADSQDNTCGGLTEATEGHLGKSSIVCGIRHNGDWKMVA